jgi:hypothetical protein
MSANQDGPAVRPSPYDAKDSVEHLLDRIKGDYHRPYDHEFEDAIHRITTQIGGGAKLSEGVPRPFGTRTVPDTQAPATADKIPQFRPDSIDADPTEVLMHVRDQVLEHGKRIPNHTCVETIQRDRYEPVIGGSPKSCNTLMAR